jgi:hypothetical protein
MRANFQPFRKLFPFKRDKLWPLHGMFKTYKKHGESHEKNQQHDKRI